MRTNKINGKSAVWARHCKCGKLIAQWNETGLCSYCYRKSLKSGDKNVLTKTV